MALKKIQEGQCHSDNNQTKAIFLRDGFPKECSREFPATAARCPIPSDLVWSRLTKLLEHDKKCILANIDD